MREMPRIRRRVVDDAVDRMIQGLTSTPGVTVAESASAALRVVHRLNENILALGREGAISVDRAQLRSAVSTLLLALADEGAPQ